MAYTEKLISFIDSPFKDDKKFAIVHLAAVTRDNLSQNEETVGALFYDRIFKVLMDPENSEDISNLQCFDILINMMASKK